MNSQTASPITYSEVSIDIENLSVSHRDPAILSIGAYFFNLDDITGGHRFYVEIDLEDSMRYGNVSASTLQWWFDQGEAAKRVLGGGSGKILLGDAIGRLIGAIISSRAERFWFNGPAEDAVWLEEAAKKFNVKMPWSHTRKCCVRTLRLLWPEIDHHIPDTFTAHHALDDAIYQAHMVKVFHEKFIAPQKEPV